MRSSRREETRARTQLMKEEESLFAPQLAVVAFGCFLLESVPLFELFGVGE